MELNCTHIVTLKAGKKMKLNNSASVFLTRNYDSVSEKKSQSFFLLNHTQQPNHSTITLLSRELIRVIIVNELVLVDDKYCI